METAKNDVLERCQEFCSLISNKLTNNQDLHNNLSIQIGNEIEQICPLLLPHQNEGISKLYNLAEQGFSGLLCDPCGLGKTATMISYLLFLKRKHNINGPHLIITPTLTKHWLDEFSKWAPEMLSNVVIYEGTLEQRKKLFKNCDLKTTIFIANKGLFIKNPEHNKDVGKFRKLVFDCLIVDEAHDISNRNNFSSSIALLKSHQRIGITATPMKKSVKDLFVLLIWSSGRVFLPPVNSNNCNRSSKKRKLMLSASSSSSSSLVYNDVLE